MQQAETERDPNVIFRDLCNLQEGVLNVGDVNSLPFYSVAVAIGLLKSDTAKRNLFHARIKMTGSHGERLAKLGCDNDKKIKKLLEQAAEHLDLYVCDVKNGICKAHHTNKTFDIFI